MPTLQVAFRAADGRVHGCLICGWSKNDEAQAAFDYLRGYRCYASPYYGRFYITDGILAAYYSDRGVFDRWSISPEADFANYSNMPIEPVPEWFSGFPN